MESKRNFSWKVKEIFHGKLEKFLIKSKRNILFKKLFDTRLFCKWFVGSGKTELTIAFSVK